MGRRSHLPRLKPVLNSVNLTPWNRTNREAWGGVSSSRINTNTFNSLHLHWGFQLLDYTNQVTLFGVLRTFRFKPGN